MAAAGVAGWRTANGVGGVDDHAEGRRDLRLRGSCRMHRRLELATVSGEPGDGGQQGQPAGDRGAAGRSLGSRAPARWSCARRTRAAARPGRRLLSGSRADARQGVGGAHARPREPGARSGRPAVDRRSAVPAGDGHLHGRRDRGNRAAVAGDDGNPAPRYRRGAAGRHGYVRVPSARGGSLPSEPGTAGGAPGRPGSTCLDRGARRAGGGRRSGRAPVHIRPGTAACGGSGFRVERSAGEGVRAVRGGHGRRGRQRGENTPRRCRRAGGRPDRRHARGVAGHRHDRPAAARQPAAWLAVPAPQSRCHIARGTGRWRQCCGLPASPACCPVRRPRSGIHCRVDRCSGPGPAAGRRHRC